MRRGDLSNLVGVDEPLTVGRVHDDPVEKVLLGDLQHPGDGAEDVAVTVLNRDACRESGVGDRVTGVCHNAHGSPGRQRLGLLRTVASPPPQPLD